MDKIWVFFLMVLLSCQAGENKVATDTALTNSGPEPSLELLADGKLRVIRLAGSPYERGLQHGKLLKKEIKVVTDSLLADIEKTSGKTSSAFMADFFAETDFVSSMERWTPDLLEEIKGIADGSEIPYDVVLMHQLGDEFFFSTKYLFAHKCSSVGINRTPAHPTLTAQNMDIPTYFHGHQTVMHLTDENGVAALVLTIPGHIGITGMNRSAVSINCNILLQLQSQAKGLPVSAIVRGVLTHSSYDAAIGWLKKIEHASGQNYLIGGKERVGSFECSATTIEAFKPFREASFTYHTNHPFNNKDYSKWYLDALNENGFTLNDAKGFCQRIPSFESRFDVADLDFGMDEIKAVLRSRDHDGPDVVSNTYTYASVIYVLSDEPQFHIAPGKPHETKYLTLQFEE